MLPPVPAAPGRPALQYPWKTNIVGTVFWVGEQPTENNPVPNTCSSWDPQWMKTFGGYDDPDIAARHATFRPASFVPKLNPFYVALPYNDCVDYKTTKREAARMIPWFKETFVRNGKSVCHNRWIAIRYQGRTCYAQWSDCGPFVTTDADYVFGEARPTNTKNGGAGIDLAPSVRDYLGFRSGSACDWRFVEAADVPDGPWKDYGRNNPFARDSARVIAKSSTPPARGNAVLAFAQPENSAAMTHLLPPASPENLLQRGELSVWLNNNGVISTPR